MTFNIPTKKFVMPTLSPEALAAPGAAALFAFAQEKTIEINRLIEQAQGQQREIKQLKKNKQRAVERQCR